MNRYDILTNEEEILYAPANCFESYPNEKIRLKLHTGEEREQLKQSIINNGIIEPIIAMTSNNRGKLVIIAGHNRVDISRELKIEVPYRLKTNLSQYQADLICIDTNLLNRQHDKMLYSELARLLYERNNIMKCQGKRNDLDNSCDPLEHKLKTREKIGKEYSLSSSNVRRYIRLCNLNNNLLNLVDVNKISLRAGVELSYLKKEEQAQLYQYIKDSDSDIPTKMAELLRKMSKKSKDIIDVINIIEEYNKTIIESSVNKISITTKEIEEFIPKENKNDTEYIKSIIIEALKFYYSKV